MGEELDRYSSNLASENDNGGQVRGKDKDLEIFRLEGIAPFGIVPAE